MPTPDDDFRYMRRALELAVRGEGHVEPNPMVGAVVVQGGDVVGEGWHEQFGGPHAEINALSLAGETTRGATLYVTLEPCCHTGKTPPCTQAVIAAGIKRVVAAIRDPFPSVDGGGFAQLEEAGIECDVGVLEDEARQILAPYLKLTTKRLPWVIAKWASSLDGKIATRTGSSQWISGESSRAIVHKLRGRVDAVLVGGNTARLDDPTLTTRPPGVRVATRIVLGPVSSNSRLAATASEAPLMVVVDKQPSASEYDWLVAAGGELMVLDTDSRRSQLVELLKELGRRRMTNVLVEGGSRVLGELFDAGQVDEVHAFIAPKLIGGAKAFPAVAGEGVADVSAARDLESVQIDHIGRDVYIHGRLPCDGA